MTLPILSLENIHKTFQKGTANENHVLKGLSLTVQKGDFISFIGGNGSGKSTLLNSIAGTFPIEEGRMLLKDLELNKLSEEERAHNIARVFQDPMMGTAPRMTVAENLAIALKRGDKRGLGRSLNDTSHQQFEELIASAGLNLESKLDHEVGLLSGGQRQVIALLMATIKKPELLLLDEHVAALDPKATDQAMKITAERIQEAEITSLMITHNMQHAIDYGNRLIMMNAGRIVVDLSGEEKRHLTVPDLVDLFHQESGKAMVSDQMLLS